VSSRNNRGKKKVEETDLLRQRHVQVITRLARPRGKRESEGDSKRDRMMFGISGRSAQRREKTKIFWSVVNCRYVDTGAKDLSWWW